MLPVSQRSDSLDLFENLDEITGVGKAERGGNEAYAAGAVLKQLFCEFCFSPIDIDRKVLAHIPQPEFGEITVAEMA